MVAMAYGLVGFMCVRLHVRTLKLNEWDGSTGGYYLRFLFSISKPFVHGPVSVGLDHTLR